MVTATRATCLLAAVVLALSVPASAAFLVDEDFEDGSADDFTIRDVHNAGSSPASYTIDSGVLKQTNTDPATRDTNPNTIAPGYWVEAFPVVESFTATFDFRLDEDNDYADAAFGFGLDVLNPDDYHYVVFNYNASASEAFDVVDDTRRQIGGDMGSFSKSQWHSAEVSVNADTGAISVIVDGSSVLSTTDSSLVGLSGKVALATVNDAASFDNFTLTPEPTTLLLLGVGLAGTCLRRRR